MLSHFRSRTLAHTSHQPEQTFVLNCSVQNTLTWSLGFFSCPLLCLATQEKLEMIFSLQNFYQFRVWIALNLWRASLITNPCSASCPPSDIAHLRVCSWVMLQLRGDQGVPGAHEGWRMVSTSPGHTTLSHSRTGQVIWWWQRWSWAELDTHFESTGHWVKSNTAPLPASSCPFLSRAPKAKPRPSECVWAGSTRPQLRGHTDPHVSFYHLLHPACPARGSPARTQLCSGVFPFWIPAEGKSLPVSHSTIFIQTMQSWDRHRGANCSHLTSIIGLHISLLEATSHKQVYCSLISSGYAGTPGCQHWEERREMTQTS